MRRIHVLFPLALATTLSASASEPTGVDFFEAKIRPVLVDRCLKCHSAETKKLMGGLALDSKAGVLRGGDSGPAVIPGNLSESHLLQAIAYTGDFYDMPPDGKLSDATIADFRRWIEAGAPDPRTSNAAPTAPAASWPAVMAERAKWWSFQPLKRSPVPSTSSEEWSAHPVDRFIADRLAPAGLSPAAPADRSTLARRAAFVLTGLPPTPEAIAAYTDDSAPNAFSNMTDRLIDSPRFGEHWARHWMDVVRYCETHGSEEDALIPFAYRYRDYLIRAFNHDVPYNRFVREHIAGDLVSPRWNEALGINEAPLPLSIWQMTEYYHTPVDVVRESATISDAQIDVFGKAFQGLTISCARCHDHKFDPVSDEDYYALSGIFSGSRPAMQIIDRPQLLTRNNEPLAQLKSRLRSELSAQWQRDLETWPDEIAAATNWMAKNQPDSGPKSVRIANRKYDLSMRADRWRRAFQADSGSRLSELLPLTAAGPSNAHRFQRVFRDLQRTAARQLSSPIEGEEFADFRYGTLAGWRTSGIGLSDQGSKAGEFSVAAAGDRAVRAIHESGFHSSTISERHGGSLRSPEFILDHAAINVLAAGTGNARLRLVIENFQADGVLFASINRTLEPGAMKWIQLPVREQWRGRRAHLELLTRDDRPYVGRLSETSTLEKSDGRSSFSVARVLFHERRYLPKTPTSLHSDLFDRPIGDWNTFARKMAAVTRAAIVRWSEGNCTDEDARWLSLLLEARLLTNDVDRLSAIGGIVAEYRELENAIPIARRTPAVIDDGTGRDAPMYPRGNHLLPGAPVARRYLEVLGSDPADYSGTASGRLQLADEIVDRNNPLFARVMVNRIWNWLFGSALVGSVDNFGRMGETPTHPELLDHLAAKFIEDGYSVKKMVRYLIASKTWQLSHQTSLRAQEVDPGNRLHSHASFRRLEAESIRDSLFAIAGNLSADGVGPGVPNYYALAIDPDKQAKPGPMDGGGRRSVYLEVRRNFLNGFLTAFDFPPPIAPVGQRDVTSVPAQSLVLLNDPLVKAQASLWADRIRLQNGDGSARVRRMYLEAFGRSPTDAELARALSFVRASGPDERTAWSDLAHSMFNMKEFIHIR